MKKIFFITLVISLLASLDVFADDEKTNTSSWGENSSVFNSGFENQEPVSDNKLKKAIDVIKQNQLSRKQKQLQKNINPLSPSIDNDHLEKFTNSQDPDNQLSQTLTVMIPVSAYNDEGKTISPGYYKLSCKKITKNEYNLELSQGTTVVLSTKAMHTEQDLEQDSIQFCNAEIIDDNRIRLMYGSLDLNLVGYLYFK